MAQEAGIFLRVWGHPGLYIQFQACQSYLRPCLKNTKQQKPNQTNQEKKNPKQRNTIKGTSDVYTKYIIRIFNLHDVIGRWPTNGGGNATVLSAAPLFWKALMKATLLQWVPERCLFMQRPGSALRLMPLAPEPPSQGGVETCSSHTKLLEAEAISRKTELNRWSERMLTSLLLHFFF